MDAHEVLAMLSRAGVEARSLTADSRQVSPGAVFLAYPGHGGARDGRDFIGAAVAAGAAAVLWEREGFEWRGEWSVPNLAVPGLKGLAGPLAAEFHGAPSDALAVIGVTGTNGKTSVTRWIAQAMGRPARPCGVIGTLGADCGGWHEDVPNTTPDAIVTQRLLARMRDSGAAACAIEVSSIGLDQARVAGVRFDTAVFTNLTRDHLDYHTGMADYEAAKARLFAWDGLRHAVVNLDDAAGERLLARVPTGTRRIVYRIGTAAPVPAGTDALLTAHAPRQDDRGIAFRLESDWGTADIAAPVWGDFNAANLLAVLGVLLSQGVTLADARVAVAALRPVPGRMDAIRMPGQPLAVIDYAHTPDALDKALAALRPLAAERGGRLVALFGAGGDRDPGKRPLMGAVAARLADEVILTSDNPRSEDPSRILADLAAGAPEARAITDRGEAIRRAIAEAGAADVILIAGKGHEPYQETGGQRLPFSDHEVAARALQDRASIAP